MISRFGGHAFAAGLSLPEASLQRFADRRFRTPSTRALQEWNNNSCQ